MSKKIRVGLVGIGRAAWGMQCPELEERSDLFEVVASCDILPDRNESMRQRFGDQVRGYTDIGKLALDPDVDLVSIATRSGDHVEHAKVALESGKHVFLEKPIGLTFEDASRLKDYQSHAKGRLFVRHNRRFEPGFLHIRDILASGILGDVHTIKLHRHNFVRRDDWQSIAEEGGGQLLNWGPHLIDHALHLLESEPIDVWSDLKTTVSPGSAEDQFKILIKGANGRIVDIEVSAGAAIRQDFYNIFGSRGALRATKKEIQLKYLDPKQQLPKITADPATPPLGLSFHQSEAHEDFRWIEEQYKIKKKRVSDPSDIWNHLHKNLTEDVPFPITLDQSLSVMKIIDQVRK
ncbi:MAG: Gfo/Idh/MocA family oxidoreductase [Pseudomonadota bacterium]